MTAGPLVLLQIHCNLLLYLSRENLEFLYGAHHSDIVAALFCLLPGVSLRLLLALRADEIQRRPCVVHQLCPHALHLLLLSFLEPAQNMLQVSGSSSQFGFQLKNQKLEPSAV